jgi:hypothetical protein
MDRFLSAKTQKRRRHLQTLETSLHAFEHHRKLILEHLDGMPTTGANWPKTFA